MCIEAVVFMHENIMWRALFATKWKLLVGKFGVQFDFKKLSV